MVDPDDGKLGDSPAGVNSTFPRHPLVAARLRALTHRTLTPGAKALFCWLIDTFTTRAFSVTKKDIAKVLKCDPETAGIWRAQLVSARQIEFLRCAPGKRFFYRIRLSEKPTIARSIVGKADEQLSEKPTITFPLHTNKAVRTISVPVCVSEGAEADTHTNAALWFDPLDWKVLPRLRSPLAREQIRFLKARAAQLDPITHADILLAFRNRIEELHAWAAGVRLKLPKASADAAKPPPQKTTAKEEHQKALALLKQWRKETRL